MKQFRSVVALAFLIVVVLFSSSGPVFAGGDAWEFLLQNVSADSSDKVTIQLIPQERASAFPEKCDLITGDRKLYHAVKSQLPWVKWIGDY